jgi:hypothetical protein
MIPQLQSQNVQKFESKKICHVFNNLLYIWFMLLRRRMREVALGCGSPLRNSATLSGSRWSSALVQ